MQKLSLSLVITGLAVASGFGHANDRLDGLDQTMQVLDDVSALQRNLSMLPSTDDLQRPSNSSDTSRVDLSPGGTDQALDPRSGFAEDIVIEEDDLSFEDDFEENEDVDDDRYDEP